MKVWLDGPKFAEFVRPYLGEHSIASFDKNFQREYNRWLEGKPANYYHVDQWLVRLGLYEHDIPDDCWIDAPTDYKRPVNHPPSVRDEALRKLNKGAHLGTLAKELNVHERTLRGWRAGRQTRSVLSPEQKEEIKARFVRTNGRKSNASELSEEFGVNPNHIREIARGMR